jgi:hypothetical protein
MAIPEAHLTNFNTMLRAVASGDLALVECTDAKSGEVRYVIWPMAIPSRPTTRRCEP